MTMIEWNSLFGLFRFRSLLPVDRSILPRPDGAMLKVGFTGFLNRGQLRLMRPMFAGSVCSKSNILARGGPYAQQVAVRAYPANLN